MFDAGTGNIISKMQRHTTLKIGHIKNRTTQCVQMTQGNKRRYVFYDRLMYAMQKGIAYDEIPQDVFITKDESGAFRVIDKHGQIEFANNYVKAARKRNRIKRIDEKIHELEIMRRAYTEDSHIEAVKYIESRKDLFINHQSKKWGTSRETVEIWYNLALEWMIEKIHSDTTQVTGLTVNMMGLMRKVRARLKAEQPLRLRNEVPSNSLTKKYK